MSKIVKKFLIPSVIILGSLIAVSGCADYEDKLIDDAKASLDLSKSEAECFVTVIVNQTGWDHEKVWNVLEDNYDGPTLNAEGMILGDAMESAIRSCNLSVN
tara:strand:- start:191 stop:496 length:306 start_codon:yes stop_codon:yes gene_type:complete